MHTRTRHLLTLSRFLAEKRCRVKLPLAATALIALTGCAGTQAGTGNALEAYRNALERTTDCAVWEAGSAEEEAAVGRFKKYYAEFSEEKIRGETRGLYAEDAYLADPFKTVEGIDKLEAYFLSSTETFNECSFDIEDVTGQNGEYYFRWTMHLVLKRQPKEKIEAIGMSHIRFNPDGKVVFHQDYWDAGSAVYERIPVLGAAIRKVKNRI